MRLLDCMDEAKRRLKNMNLAKILKKSLHILVLGCLLMQTLGCGTILYPERKGQKTGNIDVGVALLDGIGLLFFIIPGVIAFAVDFTTGAIYLPGGKSGLSIKIVHVNPDELSKDKINEIIARELGVQSALYSNKAEVFTLNKTDDISAKLACLKNDGYRAR